MRFGDRRWCVESASGLDAGVDMNEKTSNLDVIYFLVNNFGFHWIE